MGGAGNWLEYYILGFQPLVSLVSIVIFLCGLIGRVKIFKRLGVNWYKAVIPVWNGLTYGKILGRTDIVAVNISTALASAGLVVVITVVPKWLAFGQMVALVLSVVAYVTMTIALISQACTAMILVKKFRLSWSLAILYGISWDLGDSIVGLSDYTEGLCVEETGLGLFDDIKASFEYIRQHMRGYDGIDFQMFKGAQNRQASSNSSFEQERNKMNNSSFGQEQSRQTQSNPFENDARFESQSFESSRPVQTRQTPQNRPANQGRPVQPSRPMQQNRPTPPRKPTSQSNASLDFDDSFDNIDF